MKIFSFEQLVHYGVHHGGNVVNGVPWSFRFYGYAVTHENDDCYIVCRVIDGKPADICFNRGDTLVVGSDGQLTCYRKGHMIIHAYTETENYRNYPAYINVGENRDASGRVLVTVRTRDSSFASTIDMGREQLQALRDDIDAYLKG